MYIPDFPLFSVRIRSVPSAEQGMHPGDAGFPRPLRGRLSPPPGEGFLPSPSPIHRKVSGWGAGGSEPPVTRPLQNPGCVTLSPPVPCRALARKGNPSPFPG
jgi:hypothetical protein